ncbi:MAG: hypothetical protein IPM54_02700 [Polyangiaceae bacterium]|nr:hypothetical protein [Polyangiaceae bacterium]
MTKNSGGNVWAYFCLVAVAFVGAGACDPIVGDPFGRGNAELRANGSCAGGAGGAGGTGGAGGANPSGPPMMSPEEALAWCQWYVLTAYPNADVNGEPPSAPVIDGYAAGWYGAMYCYASPWPAGACLVHPTIDHCVQNILNTWCEATVEELTGCVLNMIEGNAAGTGCPTAGACDAFLAAPGCDETIVLPMRKPSYQGEGGSSELGCSLRVE